MYIIFASYGNDSIALIQWAKNHELDEVHVAHSDTGWAAPQWAERVEAAEEYVRECGFTPHRIPSIGMRALVRKKKAFPMPGAQFCTQMLKIEPAMAFLESLDPEKDAICMVGVRREESAKRRQFPEVVIESDKHGGRELWAPLVRMTEAERDELIKQANFSVLPHRSLECSPCVNAAKRDLVQLSEEQISAIEGMENELSEICEGKPRAMFRPQRHMGAKGIREVVRWAHSDRGTFEPDPAGGCDSGWCGS